MSYRRGKTQMLRDAIHTAERGPSLGGNTIHDLTPEQIKKVEADVRLWVSTWIVPAMRANLPQPRKAKP